MMLKLQTRQYFLRRIQSLSTQEKQKQSLNLCTHLWAWWKKIGRPALLAFWPLPTEPDITPFLAQVLASRQCFALPRIVQQELVFYQAASLDGPWHTNLWGIKEPLPHASLWNKQKGLVLVPGLAFDQQGGRLGRGKRFYDRYLQGLPLEVSRIGIGFSVQFSPKLALESHDQKLDGWFSPQGFHPKESLIAADKP